MNKLIVNFSLDKQAAACNADLSAVGEHCRGGTRDGGVEIGIRENDVGRFAAQLKRQSLEVACGGTHDRLAGLGGAGESHLINVVVCCQRRAGFCSACDHVDYARRKASLFNQLGKAQGRQAGLLCWLEDHGAARRQCGSDLPDRLACWSIPGNDGANDADGLLDGVRKKSAGNRVFNGLALDGSSKASVETDHARHALLVQRTARDRHAHVQRIEHGEIVVVLLDQVSQTQQQTLALDRLGFSPRAFKGAPCRGNGRIDVFLGTLGDMRQQITRCRVRGGKCATGQRGNPFPVDQKTLFH